MAVIGAYIVNTNGHCNGNIRTAPGRPLTYP